MHISKIQNRSRVIICLYVDDLLIFETDIGRVKKKYFRSSQFEMKHYGESGVILGIKTIRSMNGLILTR